MVNFGEFLCYYFVGHVVGEYFFGPDVVKPAHGHKVAKP